MSWLPIDEKTPKGRKVIVSVPNGKNRPPITMMGRYWPRHTLGVTEGYEDEDWVDQGEDGDSYMPEGWYEECEAEDAPSHNITPTHWMPLPEPPLAQPSAPCEVCAGTGVTEHFVGGGFVRALPCFACAVKDEDAEAERNDNSQFGVGA